MTQEKKWKVNVGFADEAPADGERILKEVKTLVEYDRLQGAFGKQPRYWYGIKDSDADGITSVMVEVRQRVKNKLLKRTETKTTYRTLRMKIDILNRRWRTIMTASGLPVYVTEAV